MRNLFCHPCDVVENKPPETFRFHMTTSLRKNNGPRLAIHDMNKTPWTCARCLSRLSQTRVLRSGLRHQSTTTTAQHEVSPALLARAQSVAQEHASITTQLSTSFDTRSAKRLGEVSATVAALQSYKKAHSAHSELQSLIADPDTDADLRSLANDDLESSEAALQSASEALKTSLVPPHPFAHLPCLLEIRPGAGGSEAALFAGDLLRMYVSYCSRNGLRNTLLKYEDTDGASDPRGSESPLQEAVLEIESPGSYGLMRCEAGVHRVQRVPATESKGRTHTSAVSVLVLPSFPENSNNSGGEDDFENPDSDYYIDPADVRTDIMRARGAGGQHVNTTNSAVRLTHLPTNTVVAIQDQRSQPRNREKAWNLLRSRIAQARREQKEEEMVSLRRSVVGVAKMGRGDKVRTYNYGQQRCTDHRTGLSVHDLDDVLEGGQNLENVMESVRAWLDEQEVLGLLAEEEAKAKELEKGGK